MREGMREGGSDTALGFSRKHSRDAAITREDKITHISTIVYIQVVI